MLRDDPMDCCDDEIPEEDEDELPFIHKRDLRLKNAC